MLSLAQIVDVPHPKTLGLSNTCPIDLPDMIPEVLNFRGISLDGTLHLNSVAPLPPIEL